MFSNNGGFAWQSDGSFNEACKVAVFGILIEYTGCSTNDVLFGLKKEFFEVVLCDDHMRFENPTESGEKILDSWSQYLWWKGVDFRDRKMSYETFGKYYKKLSTAWGAVDSLYIFQIDHTKKYLVINTHDRTAKCKDAPYVCSECKTEVVNTMHHGIFKAYDCSFDTECDCDDNIMLNIEYN